MTRLKLIGIAAGHINAALSRRPTAIERQFLKDAARGIVQARSLEYRGETERANTALETVHGLLIEAQAARAAA